MGSAGHCARVVSAPVTAQVTNSLAIILLPFPAGRTTRETRIFGSPFPVAREFNPRVMARQPPICSTDAARYASVRLLANMKMLRHILAILILPGTVLVPVPIMLWLATDAAYPFWTLGFPLLLVSFVASIFCVAVGLTLMAKAISLFATVGEGTLAPWDPTQRLVVRGPYRHVRNPMISGVNFILLGESIGLGSWSIAFWFLAFFLTNVLYIRFVEEPGLVRRFGESYREYRRNVPAWIPRRTPWNPPT